MKRTASAKLLSETHWLEATQADPKNLSAWLGLGTTRLAMGNYAEAASAFQHAARLDGQEPLTHHLLGLAFEGNHDWVKALAAWKKATQAQPTSSPAWEHLAQCADALHRDDTALAARQQLAKLHGNDAEMLAHLGTALSHQGHHREALALFKRAEAASPGFLKPHTAEHAAWEHSRRAMRKNA